MNIFAHYAAAVTEAAKGLQAEGGIPADVVLPALSVEPTRDRAHGDLATNAAMLLAKPARMKPRDLADALSVRLAKLPDIAKVDVAGPGFINLTLTNGAWQKVVAAILEKAERFGASTMGKAERTNVEYVSANPTGPMHVGHCRGAVFGDALANLLAFAGYDVTREYYINDAGGQVDVLARSVFLRYREALGDKIDIPEGLYPGDYLVPVGQALAKQQGPALINMPEERWLPIVRTFAIDAIMPVIKEDLAALNIQHDIFFSEASLTRGGPDQVKAAIETLRTKGFIYEGRLPKPMGHDADEWEDREQTLFRSTAFGDDVDRALQKSDGSYTYFAGDVAYHYDKLTRGYRHLINVFGADHMGYIHRMLSVVAAFTGGSVPIKTGAKGKTKLEDWHTEGGSADLDIRVVNLVKLFKNGEPFKMSKRAGTFVTLRDVVDEVGRDPVRFMMLYRKELEPLDFDFQKVTEQSKDNPVFYVQYGHARCRSVFRNVAKVFPELTDKAAAIRHAKLSRLDQQGELGLIRRLAEFPRLIESAALAHEPHRIAFYLYETASDFHALWNQGTAVPQLRFIQEGDRELTAARVALVGATGTVLATGLRLLGVEAPEEMR